MTRSQVNKLGERLRGIAAPDEVLLTALKDLRDGYEAPMAAALALIHARLGVRASARLKTVNTIVDKLRREKTALAKMQDIAGIRIVCAPALSEQDGVVRGLQELWPTARVVDRREKPNHGYRAVHVIIGIDKTLVEIQVRTLLQDVWAQTMERFADQKGREIRYGDIPSGTAEAIDRLHRLARAIALWERNNDELRRLESDPGRHSDESMPIQEGWYHIEVERLRGALREGIGEIRVLLSDHQNQQL